MTEEIVTNNETSDKGFVSGRSKVKIQHLSIGAIFTISCLIGGLFIFLGVMFNSKFLSLACPILLMIAYWGIIKNSKTGMPLSVIGDSYYYMGFIFTMFALVISLLSLSDNNGVNINSMVGSFGAALLTTIVGLLLRLATTSFSAQTKEKRKNLENEIERSLLAFSAQLETLTSEVSMGVTKVHSETQKVLIDSADGYRKVQEELAKNFKVSMERDQERISQSMQELSTKISSVNIESDIISKPIESALSDLINSLNEQNTTYKTITKDVVKTNRALSTQLSKSGSFIQNHMENLDSGLNNSLQAQLTSYESAVDQISTSILTSLSTFTDVKLEAEEQIQLQVKALSSSLKKVSDDMSAVNKPITNNVHAFNEGIDKFKVNVDKLAESSSIMNSTIISLADNGQSVMAVGSTLDAFNLSVSTLNSKMSESVILNQTTNKVLVDSANVVRDSSEQMVSDINGVYGELATQLKNLRE